VDRLVVSVVELKRAVDELSIDERLELAEHIRQSFRVNDPSWQVEIGRRLEPCLQGKGHSAEELMALHDRLELAEPRSR
jgi:putative addiction module component (TIGR02574 family)